MRALLDDRAVIALAGPDARTLLQGLITNDVERLRAREAVYAALLTPQGKILFDFILSEGEGAVLIDCAAETADALVKRLTMYRLRAKVEIERRKQLAVMASWGDGPPLGDAVSDPRLAELGLRQVTAEAEAPKDLGSAAAYRAHRLGLGVPEAGDFGQDRMFALDAGLEELHGVDFKKGCYVGQELTSRMKHRGTARKRLLPVEAEGTLPGPDTAVMAGDKSVGEIMSSYGGRGFALIRLDRLDEAGNAPLTVDGKPVALTKPRWLFP
jgi:folate-binding protein YgfZ